MYEHRAYVKEHYLQHNQQIVDELSLNECNYAVSFYAPYVEVIFNDVYEYEVYESTLADKAEANEDIIVSVSSFITTRGTDDLTGNDENEMAYPFDEAIADIGADDSEFTGEGIKVGVLEGGYPNSTVNLKEGLYTFLGKDATKHCTVVTSIIGGNTGIAEDVYLYCKRTTSNFIGNCNELIDTYGVHIINISYSRFFVGYHSKLDNCIDKLIANSGCTVVKSAGNRTDQSQYIGAPGCALNVITVGATDYNKDLYVNSLWELDDENYETYFLLKPDVVAPGDMLWDIPNIPNVNSDGTSGHSGTSFSTPMVTGVIALLMEEFPILKTNPALVKSLVHLGAEKLPDQTDYFDEQAGFGLINYQNMRNCMLNGEYSSFYMEASYDDDSLCVPLFEEIVTIPYLGHISINANVIINSSIDDSNLDFDNYKDDILPAYKNYVIKIFDLGTSTYVAESTVDSSVDYLTFTNRNANNSSFRIDIVLYEDGPSYGPNVGAIAYKIVPHSHSYTDHYTWQSIGLHKSYCRCGSYETSYHVVSPTSLIGPDGYTVCMLCRGRAPIGNLMSVPEGLAHTDNGSYILPNGTIVLVEEDVEAYLAGTLEFYYGEKE